MTWVATAIVGAGVLNAVVSSKNASAARNQADQASQRSSVIDQQLADISKEQWESYKTNVVPMLQSLSGMTKTTDRTDEEVALAAGDVKSQYAGAREGLTQALERSRNPGDPGFAALLAPSYMDEAAATSGAVTAARRGERERVENFGWNRTLQALNAWQGLPNQAINAATQASQGERANSALALRGSQLADQRAAESAYGSIALGNAATRWLGTGKTPANAGTPNYGSFESLNQGGGAELDPASAAYSGDFAYAEGGSVLGRVRGPGTPTSDSVPARLSQGEYVIPADVVKVKGTDFFDKMLQKYHRPVATPSMNGMANGGQVLRGRGLPKAVDDAIFRSLPSRAVSRTRRY